MSSDTPFPFISRNPRPDKPRPSGITAIRGPYCTPLGPRALADVLDLAGRWVDLLKFSGGAFTLFPEETVRRMISLCHEHEVRVSTGGFIERVLTQGGDLVDPYVDECARLGFDVVEVSAGFLAIPADELVRITERAAAWELGVHAEVGILFGAGGATPGESGGTALRDPRGAIELAAIRSGIWGPADLWGRVVSTPDG